MVLNYFWKVITKTELHLISATPQEEIEYILEKLKINHFFKSIIGSPIDKSDAINKILKKVKI